MTFLFYKEGRHNIRLWDWRAPVVKQDVQSWLVGLIVCLVPLQYMLSLSWIYFHGLQKDMRLSGALFVSHRKIYCHRYNIIVNAVWKSENTNFNTSTRSNLNRDFTIIDLDLNVCWIWLKKIYFFFITLYSHRRLWIFCVGVKISSISFDNTVPYWEMFHRRNTRV